MKLAFDNGTDSGNLQEGTDSGNFSTGEAAKFYGNEHKEDANTI